MTSPTPNTEDKKYSACCRASVTLSGGIGDFSDNDKVITRHYICTKCNNACNLLATAPPLEEPYDDFYDESTGNPGKVPESANPGEDAKNTPVIYNPNDDLARSKERRHPMKLNLNTFKVGFVVGWLSTLLGLIIGSWLF